MPRTITAAQSTSVDTIVDTSRAQVIRTPGQPVSSIQLIAERAQRAQISGGGAVLGEPVAWPTLSVTIGQISAGARKTAILAGLQAIESLFDDLEQGNPI